VLYYISELAVSVGCVSKETEG